MPGKGIARREERCRGCRAQRYPFSEGGFDGTRCAVLSKAAVKRGRPLPSFSFRPATRSSNGF